MNRMDYKGRQQKRSLPKFECVCITYDEIMFAYATQLSENADILAVRCNVPIKDPIEEKRYCTDFVFETMNHEKIVRECVYRKQLTKPMTAKLLEASRTYWKKQGITDWGIVTDAE